MGVHVSGKAHTCLKAKGLCLMFLGAPQILQNPEIQFFPYTVGKEEEGGKRIWRFSTKPLLLGEENI